MKKGEWHFEQVGKLIIAIILLIVLILLAIALKDKIIGIFKNLRWY